jgi:hypothetical protein
VRHDIFDRDLPSPPTLVTVQHDGRSIDAVAQATKHGFVFLFDRTNGQPLFPVEYQTFPMSTVPGEVANIRQPLPTMPKPFARQVLTADLLTNRTPEAHASALEQFKTFRSGGQFLPFVVDKQTVVFPGFGGGAEWGGQAFDPESGLYYVNANDVPFTGGLTPDAAGLNSEALYLRNCGACHLATRQGTPPDVPSLVGIGDCKTVPDIVPDALLLCAVTRRTGACPAAHASRRHQSPPWRLGRLDRDRDRGASARYRRVCGAAKSGHDGRDQSCSASAWARLSLNAATRAGAWAARYAAHCFVSIPPLIISMTSTWSLRRGDLSFM